MGLKPGRQTRPDFCSVQRAAHAWDKLGRQRQMSGNWPLATAVGLQRECCLIFLACLSRMIAEIATWNLGNQYRMP